MQFDSKVLFLKAETYTFKTKEGVDKSVYQARILVNGTVLRIKLDEKVYESVKAIVQKDVQATFSVSAFKEAPSLHLISVK